MISMTRSLGSLQSTVARTRQIGELDRKLGEAGAEMSTSRKADVYRALGNRSAEALTLRSETKRMEGFVLSNELLSYRLDTGAQALGEIRSTISGVQDLAAQTGANGLTRGKELQAAALAAIDQLIGQANRTVQGSALFGGLDSGKLPLQPWDQANPRSGLAPSDVIAGIYGAGPTNAADAAAMADRLVAVFSTAGGAAEGFEQTFYNGSPASETGRLSARIDVDETINYGVQANDTGMRETLRGLAMLAAGDISDIADPAARKLWFDEAFNALGVGGEDILAAESRMGAQHSRVNELRESQALRLDLYRSQTAALEGADPYEAATRLNQLETQLEATYAVTAKLSRLSFLNYM
ncbi:flagellin [uncultured Limimaricola sp.]|uniref:flagellin n=1 Tax=uncultured Limimaricola sp. TaxID=2211667 RepID=UPI0030FB73B8